MGHLCKGHCDGHPLMPQHGAEPSRPPPPRCGGASVASNESHRHPLGQVFTRKMGNLFGGNAWLWWLWWLWSRRRVYDMSLTMCHNSPAPLYVDTNAQRTSLWEPCPCGHGSRPCSCVQGPKKSTPHPSCQDRQLELLAAATQRRPPPQNCTCGPCNCTTGTSTTKCTATGEIPMISRKSGPWEKPLRHDREANATSRCGPQGPSPSSRRNSVKIPNRCRLTQCMYPRLNQAWR